jgi:hypothetical protein
MRSLVSVTALGFLAITGSIYAQALSEHAAAAAGATIGTAAGKPVAGALTGIFGQVDSVTATASGTGKTTPVPANLKAAPDPNASKNLGGNPGAFTPGFGDSVAGDAAVPADSSRARRRGAPVASAEASYPAIAAVPAPVREPSLEEVAGVKIGTTEKDLFAALGRPESRVSVPDVDGHLRESCQFWAGGKQLGTVRLDNGQVVKVEVRAQQ